MRSYLALIGMAALAGAACQQPEKNPPVLTDPGGGGPPPGGRGVGDASADSSPDGGACPSNLTNNAAVVAQRDVDTAVPAPLGGTIGTGTYYLTSDNVYSGVGGATGATGVETQETLFLDVSAYQTASQTGTTDGGLGNNAYASGTYTTAGLNASFTATCPAGGGFSGTYTATAGVLHVYVGNEELVYTLQ